MLKKLLVAAALLIAVVSTLLYFRAQSIFSSDLVRTNVESQLASALGQPVSIGSIGATILPRVTMVLDDVRIGNPVRITVDRLDVGASARALLSKRIDQATLSLSGARIELPLPPFTIGAGNATGDPAAITIGSIDDITLSDVVIVSGGRTLSGDVRLVPANGGMRIASMTLGLDDTTIDVTGDITDFAGPTGTLTLQASALDMLALQTFASDFAAGAGFDAPAATGAASPPAAAPPMDLNVDIAADRATFGALALETLAGQARLTNDQLRIERMDFSVLGGRYAGSVTLSLADPPTFQLQGTLADVDLAALTDWAGHPEAMTGRLAATIDASGTGTSADAVIGSLSGHARMNATDGTVKGLSLVRTLIVASSMRADASTAASVSGSEAFSALGASFTLGDGLARTDDLAFESPDVLLDGTGHIGLDGSAIELTGRLQLSEALSQQSGRDLVRYTQENGRVTVPVAISGSAGALSVQIQAADVLKRAITNKATEEAGEAIRRGLGGLFGR